MTDAEIVWAAGLFEGEGYCGLVNNYPVIALGMTDREIVEKFARIMGIEKIREIPSKRKNHNTIYEIRVTHRDSAIEFLSKLYPHLGSRRQAQATVVLERCENISAYPKYVSMVKTRTKHKQMLAAWRGQQNAEGKRQE